MQTTARVGLATTHQAEGLGRAMGRAFQHEPNFTYILPDQRKRSQMLPWFFGAFAVRLGLRYGRVYTTEDVAGGTVWLAPGSKPTLTGLMQAGVLSVPVRFGLGGFARSMTVNRAIERMREQHAPGQHWYLMALGVDPSSQGRGIGSALVQPVLAEADADGLACYLETFSDSNLAFYRRLGFEVVAEERLLKSGRRFWGC